MRITLDQKVYAFRATKSAHFKVSDPDQFWREHWPYRLVASLAPYVTTELSYHGGTVAWRRSAFRGMYIETVIQKDSVLIPNYFRAKGTKDQYVRF